MIPICPRASYISWKLCHGTMTISTKLVIFLASITLFGYMFTLGCPSLYKAFHSLINSYAKFDDFKLHLGTHMLSVPSHFQPLSDTNAI